LRLSCPFALAKAETRDKTFLPGGRMKKQKVKNFPVNVAQIAFAGTKVR
jgi:hypothetical protein